ncbi:MAG: glycosyltransferase family A protein [Nitrosopumilus sp.]
MRIGVGIPVYNGETYLTQAVESVLNQTRLPDKIIIYDDGSTDKTMAIATELGKKYEEKIRKLSGFRFMQGGMNKGIGYGRYFLAEQLRQDCDYLAFISADDVWESQFLEIMENIAKEHPGEIIFCATNLINQDGDSILQGKARNFENYGDFVKDCWDAARKYKMFVNFTGILIPTSVFEKINFDSQEKIGEDLRFLLESISFHKIRYHYVDIPLIQYRCHNQMTTVIKVKEIGKNDEKIMADIKKKILEKKEKIMV